MRLVSALYSDFNPFDHLDCFDSFACVGLPEELQQGDVLIVHGGADISPSLYKKGRSSRGNGSNEPSRRDAQEWALMVQAKAMNIPIIGICRGAQMLCALEGGHLIQDVDNHSGMHLVKTNDNQSFWTNSIHHQQLVPAGEFELIAWTPTRGKKYWDIDDQGQDTVLPANPLQVDPEFVYYPAIKGFAIQWHPEMMQSNTPANIYVNNFIDSHV